MPSDVFFFISEVVMPALFTKTSTTIFLSTIFCTNLLTEPKLAKSNSIYSKWEAIDGASFVR